MKASRWNRTKEAFLAVLQHEPGERGAILDEACGDDPDLRREVEALLRAHDESADFMELPAGAGLVLDEELCSTRIGNCLLDSVLSSGGMGAVYKATQEKPRRTVAVKVLSEALASKSALRRFEYESQILAHLTHPHIAQVYEAGTHRVGPGENGGGVPYFVMEYVPDALSVTDYARRRGLRVSERMRLFLQVCDAVHHGHQKGVIHRDLKPANILVDASGQVKVIDFGVARATDSDLRLTTTHTDVGRLVGTVQYMSPEQCLADPHALDIRSDVYALGVVMYELLCERLPYEIERVPVLEATRVIQEVDPRRPSTTNRALRGDAETIVLKALEKEPNQRYQTAAELGADIARWLDGDVILARPVGPVTRMWKLVRRSPVLRTGLGVSLVAAAALVAYVLLVSMPRIRSERDLAREERERAVTAQQAAIAARDEADLARQAAETARAEAEEEATLNRSINEFVNEMLSSPELFRGGRDVRVVDVLDATAAGIGDTYADRPGLEAELRHTLASSYRSLGLYDEAAAQLRAAVETRTLALGAEHPSALRDLAHLGRAEIGSGRYAEAEALLRRAAQAQERVLGREHRDALEARYFLARALYNRAELSEAESILWDVLETQKRVLGAEDVDTLYSGNLLASVLLNQRRYAEAEEIAREVVELSLAERGEEHHDTATHLHTLARILLRSGRALEAEPIYRELVELQRRMKGEEHPQVIAPMEELATLLIERGALAEAEPLMRHVMEVTRRRLGDEHLTTLSYLNNLGTLLSRQGKLDEARAVFEQVLEARLRVQGEEHSYTIGARTNLALTLLRAGEFPEAETMLRDVLEIRERVSEREHPHTLQVQRCLAEVLIARGESAEAAAICREVLEIARREQGERHPDTLMSVQLLGVALTADGRFEEAEPILVRGVRTARDSLPPKHTLTAYLLQVHGRCLLGLGRQDEAAESLREAYELFAATLGEGHREARATARTLVELYGARDDAVEAAAWRARLGAEQD